MKKTRLFAIIACISLVIAGCGTTSAETDNTAKTAVDSSSSAQTGTSETNTAQATATPTTAAENSGTAATAEATATPTASVNNSTATATPTVVPTAAPTVAPTTTPVPAEDASNDAEVINESFSITTEDGKFTKSGKTYTITAAGTYTLTGLLEEGCIIIDAGDDDKVNLDLNGVKITNSSSAPILALSADKVKIKSVEDTYNEIIDTRSAKSDDDDDDEGNAAIYTDCDLDLTGKGSLVVSSTYNNGIQSKDSIEIKNVTLKITAANNALRGNDSVDITSGNLVLIAEGGDGIKTSNSDISSKGNQRGTVTISGGNVDIYACCDGISAAYNIDISTEGNVNIYTDKYSNYTSGKVSTGTDFYIVVPSSIYTSTSEFYAYFYNDDYDNGVFVKASYDSMVSNGRTRYYAMKLSVPSSYENVQFFRFKTNSTPSTSSYTGVTTADILNTSKNAYMITALDSSTSVMTGDYTQISASSGNSSSKSVYSTKGMAADNAITVSNAVINIYCSDDGIHANNDNLLENNAYGVGDITIESGTITINAADDGIHGDNIVTVNGGNINIVTSYEGIEGNIININGGNTFVYATDDGLNACAGSATPMININGGYLDVTTPSGDTDAVDSNGSVTMTGGLALIKGGSSSGGMAGSVDVDGTVKVSGGTIIALGGICSVPTNSVNGYVAASTSFGSGTYTLKDASGNTITSFTLNSNYSNGWISSDKLVTGTKYTLYKGSSSVLSWTQTSGTMNASSVNTGMGGFGGGGRFR
ncbi:MAG: carbohydrate-binding domain-containing protein [Lachnospiraceae bacterium]|nr:carbohydrate-binding domain-containing protein [Lachnospiraceae bacterium]